MSSIRCTLKAKLLELPNSMISRRFSFRPFLAHVSCMHTELFIDNRYTLCNFHKDELRNPEIYAGCFSGNEECLYQTRVQTNAWLHLSDIGDEDGGSSLDGFFLS
nr:hypothetical protein [Tanacetum cinerariifolium]